LSKEQNCFISQVLGDAITIFGTGLNAAGAPAPSYSLDLHWTVDGSPAVVGDAATVPGNYHPNTANSHWITKGIADLTSFKDATQFIFETTFDLTGLDPSTAVLSGNYDVDNTGVILLNGVSTGYSCLLIDQICFQPFNPFTINSGFVSGINTLTVVLNNAGGPMALLLDVHGTADPIDNTPTPAAFCAGADRSDWSPYGQGYYCWNNQVGFIQCWGDLGQYSAYQNCAPGTHCRCAPGEECSNHGTITPCSEFNN